MKQNRVHHGILRSFVAIIFACASAQASDQQYPAKHVECGTLKGEGDVYIYVSERYRLHVRVACGANT